MSMVLDEYWVRLTRMPEKARLYARDIYFREGLRDAKRIWGDQWLDTLHTRAMLVLLPDGLVAGASQAVFQFLGENGFAVRDSFPLSLYGHTWRALWQFQMTAASSDRFLVNDVKYRPGGIGLLLESEERSHVPASVRLSSMKGVSDPGNQDRSSLRGVLGQPHRLLSFVHVPDEPADLLRDLAILEVDQSRRNHLYRSWLSNKVSGLHAQQVEMLAGDRGGSRANFGLNLAVERIECAIRALNPVNAYRVELMSDVSSIRAGEAIDWQTFMERVLGAGISLDMWDLVIVGVNLIQADNGLVDKEIGSPPFSSWAGLL